MTAACGGEGKSPPRNAEPPASPGGACAGAVTLERALRDGLLTVEVSDVNFDVKNLNFLLRPAGS